MPAQAPRRPPRTVWRGILVAVAVAAMASGCSSTHQVDTRTGPLQTFSPVLPGSTTTVPQKYRLTYLTIVARSYAARDELLAWLARQPASKPLPGQEFQTREARFIAAARATERALTSAHWPNDDVTGDVIELVNADGAVLLELDHVVTYGFYEVPGGLDKLRDDLTALRGAANVVRSALGVPRLPSSACLCARDVV